MIDNWVYNSQGEKCKVKALSEICESNITLDNYDKENDGGFETEFDGKPIPLTPEILEHNFERKGRNYVFSTDFYEVDIHEYNDGMYMLTYTSCEMNLPPTQIANICFVHKLQLALECCDVDKKITL